MNSLRQAGVPILAIVIFLVLWEWLGWANGWPARSKWTFSFLRENFGDRLVQAQVGREKNDDYEVQSDQHQQEILFRDFLDTIKNGPTNDMYLTANNTSHNRLALTELWDDMTPSDAYLDGMKQPDGFIWIGPQGTITPFHHDLTNNLLVQIVGRKRVKLVPAAEAPAMRNYLHCYSRWSGDDLPPGPGKGGERPLVFELVMEPGDALFIPVGWWHWVLGLEATIGASFTNFHWFNDFSTSYRAYGAM